MRITIKGFKKFNPRADLKSMPWLRLQNNFYDLEDFFDEDIFTTWLFIFLLCQCAQKVSPTIEMSEKYLVFKSKMKKKDFHGALSRLLAKGLIILDTNESDRISTDSCLTNEQNEHNEHVHARERVFDLELIYAEYPRKQGKSGGMRKLLSVIKSQEQFDKILEGAKKYKAYVEKSKTEKRYIKQFSSWVNQECWNDEYEVTKTFNDAMRELIKESDRLDEMERGVSENKKGLLQQGRAELVFKPE